MSQMKVHLIKGHAEMKKLAQETVEIAGLRADIKEVKDDRQHCVDSLAQAMNEVTHLKTKYDDFEECVGEEEEWQDDELEAWYEVDEAYADAAGVSSYMDADFLWNEWKRRQHPSNRFDPRNRRGNLTNQWTYCGRQRRRPRTPLWQLRTCLRMPRHTKN